jgi:hypothetical protein
MLTGCASGVTIGALTDSTARPGATCSTSPARCHSRDAAPRTSTGRHDTNATTCHGATATPLAAITWYATCPSIPSANAPAADAQA